MISPACSAVSYMPLKNSSAAILRLLRGDGRAQAERGRRIIGRRVVVGERAADRSHRAHLAVADHAGERGERGNRSLHVRANARPRRGAVIAPIVTAAAARLDADEILDRCPDRSGPEGEARRSFIACTSVWPPASSLASPFASAAASFTLDGRWYLNACMSCLLTRLFCSCAAPDASAAWRASARSLHAERIGDRVHQRGGRADRAGLAAALHAERVVRARRLARVDLERRQVVGARHAVVHERCR